MNFPDNQHDDGTHEVGARLGRLFDAMATSQNSARLEQSLPTVHHRIATRRALKISGITAGAAVLVGALAVGALAAPWHLADGPVQPADPTPTTTPSSSLPDPTSPSPVPETQTPTATPAEVPASARTALDDPGFAPGRALLSDYGPVDLSCGDPVSALLSLPNTSGLTIALDDVQAGMGHVTITNVGFQGPLENYFAGPPGLVFVQDGKVVDIALDGADGWPFWRGEDGSDVTSLPAPGDSFTTRTWGGGSLGRSATMSAEDGWHCGPTTPDPDSGGEVETAARPAGDYDVYALADFTPFDRATEEQGDRSFLVSAAPLSAHSTVGPAMTRSALEDPRFTPGVKLPMSDNAASTWVCGGSIDDVLAETDDNRVSLRISDEFDQTKPGLSAAVRTTVTDLGSGLTDTYGAGDPVLLWTQGGKIVDGYYWVEGGTQWYDASAFSDDGALDSSASPIPSLAPGQAFDTLATSRSGWHCADRVFTDDPPSGYDYPDTLPEGAYDVYAIAWYAPDANTDKWHFVASDPKNVFVGGADG